MKALFVSDLHLTGAGDPRAEIFCRFLQSCLDDSELSHLFWLGDIFDLWISRHRVFQEQHQAVIDLAAKLVKRGVDLHFFEGNHDLYLQDFWPQIGVKVHAEAAEFQLGPWLTRLEHGDFFDPQDRGYLFLRWFLRTPWMKFVARHLPGAWVNRIGKSSSAMSRDYTTHVKTLDRAQALDKIRTFCERRARESDYDLMVFGHVHIEADFSFIWGGKPRRALNLGSWFQEPHALELTSTGIRRLVLT